MIDPAEVLKVFSTGWSSGPGDVMICIESLNRCPNIWRLGNANALRKLAQSAGLPEGSLVVRICSVYGPYADNYLLGLAYVYCDLRTISSRRFPLPDGATDAPSLAALWVSNKALQTKGFGELYLSDGLVALGEWVNRWNGATRKEKESPIYSVIGATGDDAGDLCPDPEEVGGSGDNPSSSPRYPMVRGPRGIA